MLSVVIWISSGIVRIYATLVYVVIVRMKTCNSLKIAIIPILYRLPEYFENIFIIVTLFFGM